MDLTIKVPADRMASVLGFLADLHLHPKQKEWAVTVTVIPLDATPVLREVEALCFDQVPLDLPGTDDAE